MMLRKTARRYIARKILRYGIACVLLSIINYQLSIVAAQKYPERRITRHGTKLYGKGDAAGAEAEYLRATELNPELREASFNLGDAMWWQATGEESGQQKAQEAANVWMGIATDSLAPAPMISAASYNLGNASLAGRQIDAAIEFYKQSLRLNPGDMEAKFNLAYAQKLKQQQEEQQQDKNDRDRNQNDQNRDQNQNEDRNERNQDQNEDQNSQNDDNNDGNQGGNGQDGDAKIDPQTAEQMLDAIQAAEDDTREKVDAKKIKVGTLSGKNW